VEGDPLYLKFSVNRPCWSKFANFEPTIARSASAVTPSEKSSINANRKSTMRFPMSLWWSSYVSPKSPKTQNGRFP